MLIPVTMLWKVQMRLSKKLALAGIFSLVMITITFATIRAIASITSTGIRDPSWRHLWTVIEAFVGKKDQSIISLTHFSPAFFSSNKLELKKKKTGNNSLNHIIRRLIP